MEDKEYDRALHPLFSLYKLQQLHPPYDDYQENTSYVAELQNYQENTSYVAELQNYQENTSYVAELQNYQENTSYVAELQQLRQSINKMNSRLDSLTWGLFSFKDALRMSGHHLPSAVMEANIVRYNDNNEDIDNGSGQYELEEEEVPSEK